MEESVINNAREYVSQNIGTVSGIPRFPVALLPLKQLSSELLSCYGLEVAARGGRFTFDEQAVEKVEKVVRWMTESSRRGLLLCGTCGNGKTTMLNAIKRLFGTRAVFLEAQGVYDHFRKDMSLPNISARDILLIDDLGAEPLKVNDFGQPRCPLEELLLSRYKTMSTTVIATNLSFEQIGKLYGERVQDRMREMFSMIVYTEPSYRR